MSKKIMEINPYHSIIKSLKERIKYTDNESMIKDLVSLLYESSLISSGFSIEEPATFVNRINNMIKLGLSLDDDDVKEEKEDVKDVKEEKDVKEDVEENMEEID